MPDLTRDFNPFKRKRRPKVGLLRRAPRVFKVFIVSAASRSSWTEADWSACLEEVFGQSAILFEVGPDCPPNFPSKISQYVKVPQGILRRGRLCGWDNTAEFSCLRCADQNNTFSWSMFMQKDFFIDWNLDAFDPAYNVYAIHVQNSDQAVKQYAAYYKQPRDATILASDYASYWDAPEELFKITANPDACALLAAMFHSSPPFRHKVCSVLCASVKLLTRSVRAPIENF